jgi:hypothetical protein
LKVKVIPYEIGHGVYIIRMNGNKQIKDVNQDELVEIWKTGGPAYTLLIDGEIIASSGVVRQGWNRGEAWTLTGPLFYKYPKICIKAVKEYLQKIIEDEGLKRVQSLINVKHEWGDRWMKHLGFEKEGVLRKYGPEGDDYAIYSRISQ